MSGLSEREGTFNAAQLPAKCAIEMLTQLELVAPSFPIHTTSGPATAGCRPLYSHFGRRKKKVTKARTAPTDRSPNPLAALPTLPIAAVASP